VQTNKQFVETFLGKKGSYKGQLGVRMVHEGADPDGHFYDRLTSSLAEEIAAFVHEVKKVNAVG